jgi:hypothetical protein
MHVTAQKLKMHRPLVATLGGVCLTLFAASTAAQSSHSPSKMQRCQAELASVQGNTRTLQLRECLVARTEGERLITRDCAKQLRELPPDPAVDKAVMQKKCVASALNVGYAQLPKRAVETSADTAKPAAAEPAALGAKAP